MFVIRCNSKNLAVDFFKRFVSSTKKKTAVKKSFFNQGSEVLKNINSSQAAKRINWENSNPFGPLINRKSHQDTKFIREKNGSDNTHSPKECSPSISTNQNDDVEYISYFKSLDEQHFSLKNNLVIPSSNFNLNYSLNFPMLSISNPKEGVDHGVPYLQELKKCKFPSVTTILSKTMSPENLAVLERWKQWMISELGEEGFKQYQKDLFSNGSALHHSIVDYFMGTPENEIKLKEQNIGHWNSLKTVLPAIDNVKILEKSVSHPYLFYRGIVDCVATYRNQVVVIDWKTSKKHKRTMSSIYDNPLQVAAYVGALNFDMSHNIKIDSALVVVAYENGDPGDVHYIPGPLCDMYWKDWLKRLKLYWEIMNRS